MVLECKTRGRACQGTALEEVVMLLPRALDTLSFLVFWVSLLLPGNRCFTNLFTQRGPWNSSIGVI